MKAVPAQTLAAWVFAIAGIVFLVFFQTSIGLYQAHFLETTDWSGLVVLGGFAMMLWDSRSGMVKVQWSIVGYIGIVFFGLVWFAGEVTFTRFITQFAVIALVSFIVLAAFGFATWKHFSYPLLFLFLLIPIGGPIVQWLVEGTATFSVLALRGSGIPVHRDGVHIVVPSGNWTIADACSGLAYLRLCLVLGALYAWTVYRAPKKRIVFLICLLLIAIAGNWVRAYLTIAIAHATDNRWLRDSHAEFGWWLYAAIMALVAWLGWRFRESAARNASAPPPANALQLGRAFNHSNLPAFVALFALILAPGFHAALASKNPPNSAPAIVTVLGHGWQPTPNANYSWIPALPDGTVPTTLGYTQGSRRVDLHVATFPHRTWQKKLVTSVNQFTHDSGGGWSLASRGLVRVAANTLETVESAKVLGAGQNVRVWKWYWIDGTHTASTGQAKWHQLKAALTGNTHRAAWIAIVTAESNDEAANATLSAFVNEMLPEINASFTTTMP